MKNRLFDWLLDGGLLNAIPLWIWTVVRVAAVYLVAQYCGFSTLQAVFPALFAELLLSRHFKARRFKPFRLWIQPNYQAILRDAGVLGEDGEWGELLKASDLSENELRDGTTCWVLSYNLDADTYTIAWHESESNWYTCHFDLCIVDFDFESLPSARYLPVVIQQASLKLTHSRVGLALVLEVPDDWWKARWANYPDDKPSFAEEVDPMYRTVSITVAAIPHQELQYPYAWHPKRDRVTLGQRRNALAAFGWKSDYEPEYSSIGGRGISHRYASVTHEPIK
jgi:hypothetical protein